MTARTADESITACRDASAGNLLSTGFHYTVTSIQVEEDEAVPSVCEVGCTWPYSDDANVKYSTENLPAKIQCKKQTDLLLFILIGAGVGVLALVLLILYVMFCTGGSSSKPEPEPSRRSSRRGSRRGSRRRDDGYDDYYDELDDEFDASAAQALKLPTLQLKS